MVRSMFWHANVLIPVYTAELSVESYLMTGLLGMSSHSEGEEGVCEAHGFEVVIFGRERKPGSLESVLVHHKVTRAAAGIWLLRGAEGHY